MPFESPRMMPGQTPYSEEEYRQVRALLNAALEEEDDRKRTDYIATHYTIITCQLCGTYVEGVPLYFNEAGEAICADCIVVEEDE